MDRLYGSDLTAEAVRRLAQRFPDVQFARWQAGARGDPFGKRFHLISAMDVLFHIVDDDCYAGALRDLAGLLAPGGALVMSENFLHTGERRGDHHASRRLADIERAVAAAGLVIEQRRPMFLLMNEPIDAAGPLLPGWWRLARRTAGARRPSVLLGASLYPLERALVRLAREGPSTEIAVCRLRA